jgi:hypothetical protein
MAIKIITHLPEKITLKDGTELKHRTSCNQDGDSEAASARSKNLRFRVVRVLKANLAHKEDIHGKRYAPSTWIFTNKEL